MEYASDICELYTEEEKKNLQAGSIDSQCMAEKFNFNINQETDPFLHFLDTNNNSTFKNANEKSIIMAPFNSTQTHMPDTSYSFEVKNLLVVVGW